MNDDPTTTNPDLYRVVMENDRVRVLDYRDRPGDRTAPHRHPDSVMVTFSDFRRRLVVGDRSTEVDLTAGVTRWLPAQVHSGENIGDTATHVMFIELKEDASLPEDEAPSLGPAPA